MSETQWSRAIAALTPFVRGTTLELSGVEAGLLPGTIPVRRPDGHDEWERFADDSADAIVALGLPSSDSPVAEIQQWSRVLRECGTLALVTAEPVPPRDLVSLIRHLGGFEITGARVIEEHGSWLLTAERRAVAEVRGPLGTLGPHLAEVAGREESARAELYFQFGTILLQAGDPGLAMPHFASLQQIEGRTADGLFGLGMCHATLEDWGRAVTALRQAHELDPHNQQIARWLELAESRGGTLDSERFENAPR